MSKLEDGLIQKLVILYLDGGWEVSGIVKKVTESNIVLQQQGDPDLSLVFREKISCVKIISDQREKRSFEEPLDHVAYNSKNTVDDSFPMNRMAYDESGMTIPRGLLGSVPEGFDDDLAISFGETSLGSDENLSRVEFRVDDDSKKED